MARGRAADGNRDKGWNADFQIATAVRDTFWTLELAIPSDQLDHGPAHPGQVWGFNIARVRIGNGSEFGQWAPTYGDAHRPGRFGFMFFE